jgi:hypothetical protein
MAYGAAQLTGPVPCSPRSTVQAIEREPVPRSRLPHPELSRGLLPGEGIILYWLRELSFQLGVRRQGAERQPANPEHRIWLAPASGSHALSTPRRSGGVCNRMGRWA